jgi:hypothetical protein
MHRLQKLEIETAPGIQGTKFYLTDEDTWAQARKNRMNAMSGYRINYVTAPQRCGRTHFGQPEENPRKNDFEVKQVVLFPYLPLTMTPVAVQVPLLVSASEFLQEKRHNDSFCSIRKRQMWRGSGLRLATSLHAW